MSKHSINDAVCSIFLKRSPYKYLVTRTVLYFQLRGEKFKELWTFVHQYVLWGKQFHIWYQVYLSMCAHRVFESIDLLKLISYVGNTISADIFILICCC